MRSPEELVEIGVEVDPSNEVDSSVGSAEQDLNILVGEGDIKGLLENIAFQRKSEEVQIDLAARAIEVREHRVTGQMNELYRAGGIYTRAAVLANQRALDLNRAKLEMLRIHHENKQTGRIDPQSRKSA